MFQILSMTCDTFIIKTIENWQKHNPNRIVIYANGKYKYKIKEALSHHKNTVVITGDFLGYQNTRNHIISFSNLQNYKINLFLDDSYEIYGKVTENRRIKIIDEKNNHIYYRNLIIKPKEYYIDNIHETIKTKEIPIINTDFYILDKYNFINELRRIKRFPSDLEHLKNDNSERGLFYRISILIRLSRFQEAKELCKLLKRRYKFEDYIDFNLLQIGDH